MLEGVLGPEARRARSRSPATSWPARRAPRARSTRRPANTRKRHTSPRSSASRRRSTRKLLCAVIVDEPQTGSIFGGTVAAPAFGQIMSFALPYLNVEPGEPAPAGGGTRLTPDTRRLDDARSSWLELIAVSDRGRPLRQRAADVEITGARLRQPRGARRRAVLLRERLSATTATTSPPQAVASGRGGARRRAPARPRRARGAGRVGARGDGAARRSLLRRSDRASCGSWASPGPTARRPRAYLVRALLEAGGEQCGLLGTVKSVDRRRRARGRAHDARGDRPAGRPARDARRRRSRLRDGGLLARARAGPRRRRSSSPPRCSRTSRRTTSTSTPTMEDYFLAKRRLFLPADGAPPPRVSVVNVGDPYGRRLARGARRRAVTFAVERARPTTARRDLRCGFERLHASRCARRGRATRCGCRCRGASTSPTRSARSPPCTRSAAELDGAARGARARRARARAASSR